MRCRVCSVNLLTSISGQGFTEWTCEICGKEFIHQNTSVPRVCDNCSTKYHVCTDCGEPIIDNEI